MKIVIINGKAGVGKDCFVAMCKDILGASRVLNISTVDFVKEVATFCGWNGSKTPKNRKFLSDLKDLLVEWDNIPFNKVVDDIDAWAYERIAEGKYEQSLVFVHCREPKEIEKFVEHYNIDDKNIVTTLLIRRSVAENVQQINHADNDVLNYAYDYTVYNDSNLSWLHGEARTFLQNYLKLDI
jgi:guanylate kinase